MDTTELNETFDLLTHPHRRYALYLLAEESEALSIGTLATAIATWEADRTGMDGPTEENAIEIGLHHSHLPKLEDAGIVTVAENEDSITLRRTDGLDRLLTDTARLDGYPPIVADE